MDAVRALFPDNRKAEENRGEAGLHIMPLMRLGGFGSQGSKPLLARLDSLL